MELEQALDQLKNLVIKANEKSTDGDSFINYIEIYVDDMTRANGIEIDVRQFAEDMYALVCQ